MKTRIKKVRKDHGMTQQAFADALNVSHASVQSWELGRVVPSATAIQLISVKFDVSSEWLETGEGAPYAPRTRNQQIAEWANKVMADKDEAFRKRFVYALSHMSESGWDNLEKFLLDVLAEHDIETRE